MMLTDKQAQRRDSLTLDAGRGKFGVDLKHHSNAVFVGTPASVDACIVMCLV